MAAKSAYVEKVGGVYYFRKRIPRIWSGGREGGVLRLSLRTKDRSEALRRGLRTLVVFDELLAMEPREALMHLTQYLVGEQMLRPDAMTGDDLIRRRSLESVGRKVFRRARTEGGMGESLDGLYQEFVTFVHVTVQGETAWARRGSSEHKPDTIPDAKPELSAFNTALSFLGANKATHAPRRAATTLAVSAEPAPVAGPSVSRPANVYTLRYLMADYFKRDGKNTGSDNRANIERAVKLFEDLCPDVKHLAAPDIPLELWDELYEFVQILPQTRGKAAPDDLVSFARQMHSRGEEYPRLSAGTLNSNYLGAVARLVRYGAKRKFFVFSPPYLIIAEKKRATSRKAKVPFSPDEIGEITTCPVYSGSASRQHRYSVGTKIFADDHIYWAPLISMHTGMRVTEIGMLRFEQMQEWFGSPTLVLELEEEEKSAVGVEGYKTTNAVRRVPVHPQLLRLGFADFWTAQKRLGHARPFPDWTQHVKGRNGGRPEVHYEADFFNQHRLKWNVPKQRASRLTFHSFRAFFIQAAHGAGIDPYTVLKWVGHDEDTEAQTSKVHRNYLAQDLTKEEVAAIEKVQVPIGNVAPFLTLVAQHL